MPGANPVLRYDSPSDRSDRCRSGNRPHRALTTSSTLGRSFKFTSNCDLNYIAGWAALRQRTKPVVPDRALEEPSKDGHNRACVALDRVRGQLMGYVAIINKSQVPVQRGIDGKRNHPLGSNLKTRTHVLLGRAIIARFRDRRLPMSSEQCCCENYMQQKHCCGDVRALKSLRTRERRPRGSVAYN